MSKTSKELKAKKAKEFEKEKIVEEVSETTGKQKAQENVTPPEQYEILELNKISGFVDRQRGTGRPTKKERRDLDQFTDKFDFDEFDWDE